MRFKSYHLFETLDRVISLHLLSSREYVRWGNLLRSNRKVVSKGGEEKELLCPLPATWSVIWFALN